MSFSFAFGHSEENVTRISEPELRPAREVALCDIYEQAEQWPQEEVTIYGTGKEIPTALHKHTVPEGLLPVLMHEEAAGYSSADCSASLDGQCSSAQPPQDSGGTVSSSLNITLQRSDLVANVYEGGFKLWECARDLLQVIEESALHGWLQLDGATVLEAGCGAGLPGMLTMHLGASHLLLQVP